jgi:hypothetical protein
MNMFKLIICLDLYMLIYFSKNVIKVTEVWLGTKPKWAIIWNGGSIYHYKINTLFFSLILIIVEWIYKNIHICECECELSFFFLEHTSREPSENCTLHRTQSTYWILLIRFCCIYHESTDVVLLKSYTSNWTKLCSFLRDVEKLCNCVNLI